MQREAEGKDHQNMKFENVSEIENKRKTKIFSSGINKNISKKSIKFALNALSISKNCFKNLALKFHNLSLPKLYYQKFKSQIIEPYHNILINF